MISQGFKRKRKKKFRGNNFLYFIFKAINATVWPRKRAGAYNS